MRKIVEKLCWTWNILSVRQQIAYIERTKLSKFFE